MRYVYKFMLLAFCMLFQACAGEDYMPVYFPFESKEPPDQSATQPGEEAKPNIGACTVQFESTLCVSIKGEKIEVGTGDEEPLCADVEPIPIEVNNGEALIIRGNTFPDIPFEGHGLPAPITINGKGSGDGADNIGNGSLDGNGNITIEGFSFFVNALGMVGEIPELNLTTGEVEGVELPTIEGIPLSKDGAVLLVAGTTLGHLFPAADEKLFGAELQATFEGTITPDPFLCKGSTVTSPQSTFITKLVADNSGQLTESLLPGGTEMEVGSGTFIAETPQDIGPKFESAARFKIINATSKPISIDIPPIIGAFFITAREGSSLKKELPPKTPLVIDVSFQPTSSNTKTPGKISETLFIAGDVYHLTGTASVQKGTVSIDILDNTGGIETEQADSITFGEAYVGTSPRREFFLCKKIKCGETEKPTQCVPCIDVLANVCQLIQVDAQGNPTEEVDSNCKQKSSLSANSIGAFALPSQRTIKIKNLGTKPIEIISAEINEISGSRSINQFKIGSFAPKKILPYDISKESLNVVVIYQPTDMIGFDGAQAVIGNPAKDKAILSIITDTSKRSFELSGLTAVKESPQVEVYIKTSTGTKELFDGSTFAFRGITTETTDSAAPLFLKLSDSAVNSLKITKIELDNNENFEWLDTGEKILAKPENSRCTIPPGTDPVSLIAGGWILSPGKYSTDNMPLFGCVNFHMAAKKMKQYEAGLKITTNEVDANGNAIKNPDGSVKQSYLNIKLLAVVNPMKGKIVWRMTQTMAIIMNPQFPSNSAVASKEEVDIQIADGLASESDRFVMPSAVVLDPFDEETIKDEAGNVESVPGDGITAVYRKVDSYPVSKEYEDPLLPDWVSLYDSFYDFPNMPKDYKGAGLRIYTAGLSYPGPLAPAEKRPENVSLCQQVDPCDPESQKLHGKGPTDKSKRGVCAFFYTSAGSWDSPAFNEENQDLCKKVDEPQKLNDFKGYYELNGRMNFPDAGLRLWGPTYFHNPAGPLGPVPPMNAVFHVTFTTDVLAPKETDEAIDLLPDKRINTGKLEYKINLNDTTSDLPRLCETSVKNRLIHGEYYSTWKYLAPYLVKDEEGKVPAGCPEPGNDFNGGSAYLRGKPVDQETGQVSFVAGAKFASDDNLTFAFKDVMFFIVLNGWFCDPTGPEELLEGSHCYDLKFNERDAKAMVSIMK